ncbi:MAG: hypothetical protein DI535_09425 [Citrobacter freundii]|nr:MAG: hypothetical protein DI535_09425 [Citrobacter freundii]
MHAKILIGLLAILATSSSFNTAGIDPVSAQVTKTIAFQDKVDQANFTGHFEIVLVPSYSDKVIVEGEQSIVEQVETAFRNGKLSVYDNRFDKRKAVRIYVAAKELSQLFVYGQGSVTSEGKLISSLSKMLLDGEIEVKVNATCKLNVTAGYDYDLVPGK